MSYAIFRVQKHKTAGTIRAASQHMTRSRPTPNADPDRLKDNRVLIGDGSMEPSDLVNQRIEESTKPLRKNGVRAVELFLGMSPEWAAEASEDQLQAWVGDSRTWAAKTFGSDNLVSMILHRDETTPHLTAFVVPVHPETGKLNASHWLDGKEKLQALQDSYAKAMEPHGLERGIAGSKARHTTVAQFYRALRTDVGSVQVPEVGTPPVAFGREDWREGETDRLRKAVQPQVVALKHQARSGILATRKAKDNQATVESLRSIADQVRPLPLSAVLEQLGLKRDKGDKNQWIDAEKRFRITLKESQFMDHAAGKGGGGAIDLAMHVLGQDYKSTVSWLANTMGTDETIKNVASEGLERARSVVTNAKEVSPFKLPTANADKELAARYLTSRGLPRLFADNPDIVTDERKNIGFVMRNEAGEPRGLELKGTGSTPFKGLAPGSSRESVFKIEKPNNPEKGYDLVVTESAVDALSYYYMHRGEHKNGLLVVSTSGARGVLPKSIKGKAANADKIFVAFDDDQTGHKQGAQLISSLRTWFKGTVKRAIAAGAKDWNEALMTAVGLLKPATPSPVPAAAPSVAPQQVQQRRTGGMEM